VATVVVYLDDEPAAGIDVVFHDPAGAPIAHVDTDEAGEASWEVVPGSMLTVARFTWEYELLTVMGVEPGDRIEVRPWGAEPAGEPLVTVSVQLPGAFVSPEGATAPYYTVQTCFGGSGGAFQPAFTFPVAQRCSDSGLDVAATALDAANRMVAFTSVAGVAVHPWGVTSVPLPAWRTDFWPLEVRIDNPPAGVDFRSVSARFVPPSGWFIGGSHEGEFPATISLPRPPEDAGTLEHTLFVAWDSPSPDGPQRDGFSMLSRRSPTPWVLAADGAELLPRISDVAVDTAAASPVVFFRLHGSVAAADAAQVIVGWSEPSDHAWTLLTPPDVGSPLVLPTLPDALSPFRPRAGVAAFGLVTFFDAESVRDYRAARATPYETMSHYSLEPDETLVRTAQGWRLSD
jgi:hypothetical protein